MNGHAPVCLARLVSTTAVQNVLTTHPKRSSMAPLRALEHDGLEASARVMRLVDELGFDPVDAGGIAGISRAQPRA